jgi:hypothetical protein
MNVYSKLKNSILKKSLKRKINNFFKHRNLSCNVYDKNDACYHLYRKIVDSNNGDITKLNFNNLDLGHLYVEKTGTLPDNPTYDGPYRVDTKGNPYGGKKSRRLRRNKKSRRSRKTRRR